MTPLEWLEPAGAALGATPRPTDGHWYPDQLDPGALAAIVDLYRRYQAELLELARITGEMHPRFEDLQLPAQFGDVEGELVYMLIRELHPDVVWEMSPAAGWSTNYLLAALTQNDRGIVHAFERAPEIGGRDTATAIRDNLSPAVDSERLTVHVGDARVETRAREEAIDFLLVDSCHEAWFAEWYLHELVPRVNGVCFVHDVVAHGGALKHAQYLDGEAYALVEWLQRCGVAAVAAAAVEDRASEDPLAALRKALPRRVVDPSFGVFFAVHEAPAPGGSRPRAHIRDADLHAIDGDHAAAREHLRIAEEEAPAHSPHALLQIAARYHALGLPSEGRRVFERVLVEHRDEPLWTWVASRYAVRLGEPAKAFGLSRRARRHSAAPRWVRDTRSGRIAGVFAALARRDSG